MPAASGNDTALVQSLKAEIVALEQRKADLEKTLLPAAAQALGGLQDAHVMQARWLHCFV